MIEDFGMRVLPAMSAREQATGLRSLAAVLLLAALLASPGEAGAQAGGTRSAQASDQPAGKASARQRGKDAVKAGGEAAPGAGEAIYRRGVLGSGAPLTALREAGGRMSGAAAACINCHRRSGFGAKEGRISIPPVTGRYLFRPRASISVDADIPYVASMRGEREPYTDATLARAIREGLDSEGKPLNYLMPNFDLGDADMVALIAYLKSLDHRRVPGVSDTELHFATIVTPDADPAKRRGMLDVMEKFFTDRNSRQMVAAPRMRSSSKTSLAKSMFMVHRQWKLHVWELTGAEATWGEQLERHLAREPVLAVVSGVGGRSWEPVHAFCERSALPCLFPNVEAPPKQADHDFYSLYFSRGVLLEADLIANRILKASGGEAVKSVHQVYRAGDSGEAGAGALAAALEQQGIKAVGHVVKSGTAGVAEALRKTAGADALVLWLRPDDLAALGDAPAAPSEVYLSGIMGGLENAPLPSSWREHAHMAYPFDLAERRRVRVDFALGWFRIRKIPVVAAQVQADTYLTLGLISETLNHMVDTFVRDYLVERIEDTLAHRVVTGYYPHLAMATGQRFGSKGGYVVRFAEPTGNRVVAEQDWITP